MEEVEQRRLIEQHLALVQSIARKLKRTLGASMDVDDLVAYGSKGLVEAAQRFDAQHGVAFSTFAYYRIRGAMLDGVRAMGWYSRADYARYRAEEAANQYLQAQADRDAAARVAGRSQPEAGDVPASSAALESVAELLTGIATIHITSLDAAAAIPDDRVPPPDAHVDSRRLGARARGAIERLPERERRLLELYYFAGKNLEEAGAELGLSKSWACRLHARGIDLLREAMADAL